MPRQSFTLFLLFLLAAGVIFLKVTDNPSYYSTPDSKIYLDAANHLLAGKGYYITYRGTEMFNSFFPVGYSALIAFVSGLTSLSTIWAAKLVNVFAIGGLLLLLSRMFKAKVAWVGLIVLSSTLLQVASNTWSETVFLTATVAFAYSVWRYMTHPPVWWRLLFIFISGTAMFLCRYVGLFAVIVLIPLLLSELPTLLFGGKFKLTNTHRLGVLYAIIGIMAVAFGYMSYEHRHEAATITAEQPMLIVQLQGILARLNETALTLGQEALFFVRDWDFRHARSSSPLAIYLTLLTLGQGILIGFTARTLLESNALSTPSPLIRWLAYVGVVYCAVIVGLYVLRFDFMQSGMYRLYYRYYFPGIALIFCSLLGWLTEVQDRYIVRRINYFLLLIFLLSVLHSLPKAGWLAGVTYSFSVGVN